jgi:hypothetical protein
MSELFTIDEIEKLLREEVVAAGGAKKWCVKNNVSMGHALHMVENGTAASLPRVLDVLGLEKVTRYMPRGK